MAFIPSEDSAELTYMKSEFPKLSEKIDSIARSLDDTKDLIESKTQQAAYVRYEHNINEGFLQLKACLKKIENVTCNNQTECNRKKVSVAQSFISSMNVRKDMDAIFRGTTSDSMFGKSLLNLLQEESKCDIPKINILANKITSLITKAITVTIFHDYVTKTGYNVLDDTSNRETMLLMIENKRQSIQDLCFKNIDNRLAFDVKNAHTDFSSDSQTTNTALTQTLKKKYTWSTFQVFTFSGENRAEAGPIELPRRYFRSTSKTKQMHAFVIPTYNATVVDFAIKIKEWKKLAQRIDGIGDINKLESHVKRNSILDGQVQAYAILPGSKWVVGYYTDEGFKQHTLGTSNFTYMNVFVNRPRETKSFLVAVSFRQADVPLKCSASSHCNGHGDCYAYPYSTHTGCKCDVGFSGDKCESSERNVHLQSVINSLLENTLKLPTLTSIQHGLEDAHMSLTTSSNNIQSSISNLETTVYEKFRSMGDLISRKFDLLNIYIKYQNAIESVQYFSSVTNTEGFNLGYHTDVTFNNVSTNTAYNKFSSVPQKEIELYLLNPSGIKKWLYEINYLIVGKRDSE